jgi:hypothetical protein
MRGQAAGGGGSGAVRGRGEAGSKKDGDRGREDTVGNITVFPAKDGVGNRIVFPAKEGGRNRIVFPAKEGGQNRKVFPAKIHSGHVWYRSS